MIVKQLTLLLSVYHYKITRDTTILRHRQSIVNRLVAHLSKLPKQEFLFDFDSGPDWRGEPSSHRVGQWMWPWHYGMEESASLLEEHGYFKVLETQKVQMDEAEAERIARELEKQKREEEEYRQRQQQNPEAFFLPFFNTPIERSSYGYVIIAQRREK